MLCSACRKKEAVFSVKTVVRRRLVELKLCADCLHRKEAELGLDEGALSFYAEPLGQAVFESGILPREPVGLKCPACGLAYAEFRASGVLGCPSCYQAFRPQLKYLFRFSQGAEGRAGRRYTSSASNARLRYSVMGRQEREAEIKKAVAAEDFEKAALIRGSRRRKKK